MSVPAALARVRRVAADLHGVPVPGLVGCPAMNVCRGSPRRGLSIQRWRSSCGGPYLIHQSIVGCASGWRSVSVGHLISRSLTLLEDSLIARRLPVLPVDAAAIQSLQGWNALGVKVVLLQTLLHEPQDVCRVIWTEGLVQAVPTVPMVAGAAYTCLCVLLDVLLTVGAMEVLEWALIIDF